MKRKSIITSIIIIALLFVGLGVNYVLSLHRVSFTLDKSVSEIKIYSSDKKEIGNLTTDGNIHVKSGKYYLVPSGENIATDNIPFTIDSDDKTINVRPPYTKDHLKELLKRDQPDIEATISAKYSSLYSDYRLIKPTLYERGEWFGGLLTRGNEASQYQLDYYRIVLHKKDGKWEVIRRPEYTLSASRYSQVPIDILRQINQLVP